MAVALASTKRLFGFGDKDDHVVLEAAAVSVDWHRRRQKVNRGFGQYSD